MRAALFVVLIAVLFTLPLLPSLRELLQASDTAPLKVMREHDGNPMHFANRFRDLVQQAQPALKDAAPSLQAWQEIGQQQPGTATLAAPVITQGNLKVRPGQWAENDVYAAADIVVGTRGHLRAGLAEGTLVLQSGAAVLRWAQGRDVRAEANNELWGRLTATRQLHVMGRAVFQRLHAPRIIFGPKPVPPTPRLDDSHLGRPELARLGRLLHGNTDHGRWVFEGDVTLPRRCVFEGDIVVRGALKIGAGCVIRGSVKARDWIHVGAGSRITGAVVAQRHVRVSRGASILGPLIGEEHLYISKGCRMGSRQNPTTVSAERIEIRDGCVVYGTVWAKDQGRVVGIGSITVQGPLPLAPSPTPAG